MKQGTRKRSTQIIVPPLCLKLGDKVFRVHQNPGQEIARIDGPYTLERVHKGNGNFFVDGNQYRPDGSSIYEWLFIVPADRSFRAKKKYLENIETCRLLTHRLTNYVNLSGMTHSEAHRLRVLLEEIRDRQEKRRVA